MNWYAIKFSVDYADEFDVEQAFLVEKHVFDRFMADVNESKEYPFEIYFGTNEYIEFYNARNVLKCFTILGEATDGFAQEYQKLFKRTASSTLGDADWLWRIWESVNEDHFAEEINE